MSLLVFSHANSFPAGTYRVLFKSLRARGFTVRAVEKFGHNPLLPVSNNWPNLIQELGDFTAAQCDRYGEPAFMVGHSLGGFLSLMTACQRPELARGVLLIDSPILTGWRATTLGVIKRAQLAGSFTPGAISRKRRHTWASKEEALEHLRHKRAFASWDEQVLQDYIEHGTRDEGGKRVLSFSREVETAIYNTLPDNMEQMLRRYPLKCPAAFIGGLQSVELQRVGIATTERIVRGRVSMLDGSHLFPMEKPLATAAAIEAALRSLPGA